MTRSRPSNSRSDLGTYERLVRSPGGVKSDSKKESTVEENGRVYFIVKGLGSRDKGIRRNKKKRRETIFSYNGYKQKE